MYGCGIRRTIPPLPPPSAIAGSVVEADEVRPPSPDDPGLTPRLNGLGRNLAGILADAASRDDGMGVGLRQLLGRGASATPPRVREFITEAALGAIAEGFGAEAVAIARVDDADNAVVSSRLPPSWEESSSLTFELYGQLWGLLERRGARLGQSVPSERSRRAGAGGEASTSHVVVLHKRATWLGWQATGRGDLAAAVVRHEPFTDGEKATLSRLVRSVAFAIGAKPSQSSTETEISALLVPSDERWRAEAIVAADGKRRRAIAEADEPDLAVARAAAKLCRVPAEVSFAGRTDLDGMSITLVVVHDRHRAPFLGLAVTEPDRVEAAAEAVFSAVSGMDGPLESGRAEKR
ncbi:MAG: hypothetical protein AAGD35_20580 [Actinomycetota bacterium]